jgi:hypothetical protein
MNVKQLIAAVSIFAATGSVFAAEWADFSDFVPTKTRAEVVAELKQAQADGTLAASQSEIAVLPQLAGNARSRAEVRAEAIQSVKNHSNVNDIYFGG